MNTVNAVQNGDDTLLDLCVMAHAVDMEKIYIYINIYIYKQNMNRGLQTPFHRAEVSSDSAVQDKLFDSLFLLCQTSPPQSEIASARLTLSPILIVACTVGSFLKSPGVCIYIYIR